MKEITEIIVMSKGEYDFMFFGLGLLVGFILSPIFMWIVKKIGKELEK
jgi:flagellar biogenesis protein FliO